MKRILFTVLAAVGFSLLWGCASTGPQNLPEYNALKGTAAGRIVVDSIKMQGYPAWTRRGGMWFDLRTRIRGEDGMATYDELYTCDLKNHRVHAQANEGLEVVKRIYSDNTFRKSRDGVLQNDMGKLDADLRRIVSDYFFSVLPFWLGRRPGEMELLEDAKFDGITYKVIEVRYGNLPGHLPPDSSYRFYFNRSTQRLAKVFFHSRWLHSEGRYVWCEFDNYSRVDGVLIPLHRKFTFAADETGKREKKAKPFLEQWITEAEFSRSVNADLFLEP